jgi:uncharacterized protein (TIGR03435 family)
MKFKSVSMCLLIAAAAMGFAQTSSSTQKALKFEVASLKPSQPGGRGGEIRPAPGGERYLASNITLKTLLTVAYGLKGDQIVGGPGWIDTEPYDMNAKAEHASSFEELHAMLQSLLNERFKLQFHREAKELSVYALTVDKGEPKLTAHQPQNAGDPWIEAIEKPFLHVKWSAKYVSMDYFAWRLAQILDRPVVNLTKLGGGYDFELSFTRELPPTMSPNALLNGQPIDISGPNVFEAVRRQLNLKLEPQKAPTEIIVIDYAERAVEN